MLRLDALAGDDARKGEPVDAQHTPDTDRFEPAVVNQAPDRLGVHAEPVCDLADAVETFGVDVEHALNVAQACGLCMGRTAY